MKKKIMKLLAFALVLSLLVPFVPANAATATPKLNVKTATITGVGAKKILTLTAPKGSKATWKSSDTSIATVTSKGIVTSKKKGTVTITCSVKVSKKTTKLTCKVTVKVPSKAVRFKNAIIDKEYNAHILTVGTPYNFNYRLTSTSTKSTSSDIARFSIADSTIATVNPKSGVVTPLKAGNTTLRVSAGADEAAALSADNTIYYEIGIKVVAPSVSVTNLSLNSAKELAIKFSKAMNSSTLIGSNNSLSSNISITPKTMNNTNAADLGTLTATLSTDQQTLYIRSTNAFNGTYNISLNSSILSTTGVPLEAYNKDLDLKDNIAPTFAGTTTDDTGLVALIKFSEPIDITKLTAMDPRKGDNTIPVSSSVFTTASNYKLLDDKMTLSIDLSSIASSDKGTQISVKLAGIVDLAGNATDPYPLTVFMTTDTSSKPQAVCQSVIRNGNSLVATFSSSIQTPGYAIINGSYITGAVNVNNKKEVIYNLSNTGLTSLTGAVAVTLTGYAAYNATGTTTQYSTTVNFSVPVILPVITSSTLTTKLINNTKQTVLTLTYDKNVTLKTNSGSLSATSSIDGVIGVATSYAYTASVTDKVVTIILTGNFVELGTYNFTIPAEFVKDTYNNFSTQNSVSVLKVSGDTQVLPAPVSIQLDNASNTTIYVTFNNMLDVDSAQTVSNYKISGLNIASAKLIANSYASPAIVQLDLASGSTVADIPYQITISGVKGYKNSYSAMNKYTDMLSISNNKTLPIIFNGTATTKKIILTSGTGSISTSSVVNYTFTCAGKTLTLKSAPVITGSTVTFEFNETIVANSSVTIEPAVNNSIVDMSNRKALNLSASIIMY